MVLSKRERIIGIGVGAAIAALTLDHFLFTPAWEWKKSIDAGLEDANQKTADVSLLFSRQKRLRTVWADMKKGGLKTDASEAETQALQAVLDWTRGAGVDLAAVKPERSTTQGKFQVISFHVTGTGSMPAVSRLLWSMETATIPVRLNDVQVTPRKEGTDDLSVQLSVSTLCMLPESANDKPAKTAVSSADAGWRAQ